MPEKLPYGENKKGTYAKNKLDETNKKIEGVNCSNKKLPHKVEEVIKNRLDNNFEGTFNEDGLQIRVLPECTFMARNSVLTDIFENEPICIIYNLFITFFIFCVMDMAARGVLMDTLVFIVGSFSGLHTVLLYWSLMLISIALINPFFRIWANYRFHHLSPKSITQKLWDITWLCTYICYSSAFLYFSAIYMHSHLDIYQVVGKIIYIMEQLRFQMKSYAFIRGCAPRILNYKPHTENCEPKLPRFSHYLYFIFAPTLIYKDSYPRTKLIRWRNVLVNLYEFLATILVMGYLFNEHVRSNFHQYGLKQHETKMFTYFLKSFSLTIPALFGTIIVFYNLLHAYQNIWAEMLRFADRQFYNEWWKSDSFSMFYRTWNIVVHNWLYTYVYKDVYEIVTKSNRTVAKFTVFLISGIIHEYTTISMLGFCYPMFLVGFIFAGLLLANPVIRRPQSYGNVFVWLGIIYGIAMLFTVYSMEYYARLNCKLDTYKYPVPDFYVPYSWVC